MDDVKKALLGDHEAAKRLTEAGVLVPCWRCGGEAELQEIHTGGKPVYAVSCKKHHCGAYGCAHQTKKNAVAYWNTRAPILNAEEMEMLERLEKEAGPCLVTLDEVTEITQEQWEQLRSRIKRREADSC